MVTRLTINIPEELRRRVRAKAVKEGHTISDIVRLALEAYVDEISATTPAERLAQGMDVREDDPVWELSGAFEGGPSDLSSNLHKYETD